MDAMRGSLWLAAAMSGLLGWSGRFEWLPLGALVLVLWRLSRTRLEAIGVAGAYYAAPSFGWMRATSTFFGSEADCPANALFVWLGAAALLTLPWALLWSERFAGSPRSRLVRGTALGLILMLPPLGLLSWCNPWVAGAATLPGLGLAGFGLVTLGAFAPGSRSWPWWTALWLIVLTVACDRYEPGVDRDWAGLSTRYGKLSDVDAETRYERAVSVVRAAKQVDATLVLVPEGLAGRWTESTAALWSSEAAESDRVLLIGALEERVGERRNGLVIAGKSEARFLSQRLPAPIGMWAPWRPEHVRSELARSSVVVIEGRRAAMLVCFEQFVSWPALQTALEKPDVVLAPANLWFANGTNLNAVREVTLRSWAALMRWSVVEAING
jgi:hypothetical protein